MRLSVRSQKGGSARNILAMFGVSERKCGVPWHSGHSTVPEGARGRGKIRVSNHMQKQAGIGRGRGRQELRQQPYTGRGSQERRQVKSASAIA